MRRKLSYIIKEDNFLSLSGNLVVAGFGLVSFAILARSFDLDVFGQWILFVSCVSFIEMLRFGITSTGVVRFLSGASKSERAGLLGANALIGLVATCVIVALLIASRMIFAEAINQSGYRLFFEWYPVLAFISLPWNTALVSLQADNQFGKIFVLKSINSISFCAILALSFFFLDLTISRIIISMVIINAATSLLSLIKGWDGIRYLGKANRDSIGRIMGFGKYTTVTLVGTNLLRNADTLIIGLSPLGNSAVALYSIPLKLTELQQIPLRSFTATAFPKMSKASIQGELDRFKRLFYEYSGSIFYLFLIMSAATFFFADFFVRILAGEQFLAADPVAGIAAVGLLKIFSVYGLLLPVDRMTGIALDSLNKPDVNAVKVVIMLLINVIGDLVAVFVFNSLVLVALSSIIFTAAGIFIGMYFLNREITMGYGGIFRGGKEFCEAQLRKISGKQEKVINA